MVCFTFVPTTNFVYIFLDTDDTDITAFSVKTEKIRLFREIRVQLFLISGFEKTLTLM